jgi:PhnB protein
MQKTFWTEAFGMVTDQYGTPWMVGGGEHKG